MMESGEWCRSDVLALFALIEVGVTVLADPAIDTVGRTEIHLLTPISKRPRLTPVI